MAENIAKLVVGILITDMQTVGRAEIRLKE
jgi:hypothetical protein